MPFMDPSLNKNHWRDRTDTHLFNSYRFGRRNGLSGPAWCLFNVRVVDVVNGTVSAPQELIIEDGRILSPGQKQRTYAVEMLDMKGMYLMPGLCDCHVHCTAFTADLPGMLSVPESLTAVRGAAALERMLLRGFTTVRDCGGADHGLAQAIEEGLICAPRLLFTGHALSQTGGHGDMRSAGEDCFACGAALRGIGRVCDGDAAVRTAARDELRKGAHCIKIMASGGVSSPTDRLTNTQFSLHELTAIVEEAKAAGTYVCAHAYTSEAVQRAVQCGVKCIEHGNCIDQETAEIMAVNDVYLVQTIVTYHALTQGGADAGMKPELLQKVGNLLGQGINALKYAKKAGVKVCYGSDLIGVRLQEQQAGGIIPSLQALTPLQVLQSMTINPAKLFGLENEIGQVKGGFIADLILVDKNPLEDIKVLTSQANIKFIMKQGWIVKDSVINS